jgi:hypothetical protein
VVSVARREPIDVVGALEAARGIETDEPLARELVRVATDADETTIVPLLQAVENVEAQLWRARALSGVLRQAPRLTKTLPAAAQELVTSLVGDLDDEIRGAVLRTLTAEVPESLAERLVVMGRALADPWARLQAALHWDPQPDESRAARYLEQAQGIDDDETRAAALALVAPRLTSAQLEIAYASACRIEDPDARALGMLRVADRFENAKHRSAAQVQILGVTSSMMNPLRRFDVMVHLLELPEAEKQETATRVFDLATRFDDPEVRCRALFMASSHVTDQILEQRALLSGLAAAECVWDEDVRAQLFLLLRPGAPTLAVPVRRELTRAVERLESTALKDELYSTLGRFFSYERPQAPGAAAGRKEEQWDVFVSFSTEDLDDARFVASELVSRGMRVFLSADRLDAAVGSVSWTEAIDQALLESRALLVLLTEEALASKWVREEWRKYYRLIVETEAGCLLTLRLGGPPINELPLTLRMYQCIDSDTGRIEPGHLTRILDIIRGA